MQLEPAIFGEHNGPVPRCSARPGLYAPSFDADARDLRATGAVSAAHVQKSNFYFRTTRPSSGGGDH